LASRISSKVCAAFLFASVLACGSKTENKVKPLAGAGATGNTAVVANLSDSKPADPSANGAGTPTVAPANEDAMKYIAENSTMLAVIDVKKMVSSPLMANPAAKAQLEKLKQGEEFKMLTAAGVDPFTNVDKIVVSGDAEKEIVVIVVTGTFDPAKAAEAVKVEFAKDGKGSVEVVGNALIMGEKADHITLAKSAKGVDGSPMLKDAMAMADITRAMYLVANIPASATSELKDLPVPGLTSAKNVAVGLSIEKGFDLMISLQLGSETDAAQAKTGIEGFLPMGAVVGIPPEVLSAAKVEAKGSNVNFTMVLTEDMLKKLEEMAKQMNGGAPGMEPMPMPEGAKEMPVAPGAKIEKK
jgi:hypothetical protein